MDLERWKKARYSWFELSANVGEIAGLLETTPDSRIVAGGNGFLLLATNGDRARLAMLRGGAYCILDAPVAEIASLVRRAESIEGIHEDFFGDPTVQGVPLQNTLTILGIEYDRV